MARRVVDLHPEAIGEGREVRNWYRERSYDVEERFRVALRRAIRETLRNAGHRTKMASGPAAFPGSHID
jgi:hypothetical protein